MNVRGLNDHSKIKRLQSYLQFANPKIDCLLIQEHKLIGDKVVELGRVLNRQATYIYDEAEAGYNHLQGDQGAGRGGTALVLASKWYQVISSSGSLYHGRVLWIVLKGIPGGDLGIANIYSLNDCRQRSEMWHEILNNLPRSCRWILRRDFNMVETSIDKSSQCGRLINGSERII
jgi:hypothetical protein